MKKLIQHLSLSQAVMNRAYLKKGIKQTALICTVFFIPVLTSVLFPAAINSDLTSRVSVGDSVDPVALFFKSSAHAARKKSGKKKSRKTPLIRQKTFKSLSKAQEYAEEDDFKKALEVLDKVKARTSKLNSYELAQLWNFYAFIYSATEQYGKSIDAYKKVLEQDNIPEALEQQSLYRMGQLLFVSGKYQEAIKQFEYWFTVTPIPSASSYVMLGQAYYQAKNFDVAIEKIETAVTMFTEKQKTPKESWYLLLRAMYFQKDDIKQVQEILETLMVHYPKSDYWVQLASIYGELKREGDQIATMDAAHVAGYLDKESQFLNLAYMYLSNDVPYKAAKIIDEGVKAGIIESSAKNLRVLANSWRASQEIQKSIPVMEKAARLSGDGELFARLGNIYLDSEEFEKSVKALRHGLKKGGVKRADQANVALGMALFNLDKLDEAERAFKLAKQDKRTKKMATQWISYLSKERKRRRQLADGMIQ